MAITIDNNLLIELGLSSLNQGQKRQVLARFYDVFELRVGVRVTKVLNDQKIDEFMSMLPDPAARRVTEPSVREAALDWLSNKVPEYRIITAQEFEYMKETLRTRIAAAVQGSDDSEQTGDDSMTKSPRDVEIGTGND